MRLNATDPRGQTFGQSSPSMLLAILDQSPDCIKILSIDGRLDYMNRNGQCAMEIDDFCAVAGASWSDMWPAETKAQVEDALIRARLGEAVHFSAECPTAKGTRRWWDVSVTWYKSGDGPEGFVSISRDITQAVEGQKAAEAVAAEMRHRLGNAYHVVGSLFSSFARGEAEKEQFVDEMLGRLNSLAAAQSMHADEGEEAHLDEIVTKLVLPYETPSTPINISSLPRLRLENGEVDALAMVLGELCVNSTKHGALKFSGDISLSAPDEEGQPRIIWSEKMDRPVTAHAREGGKGLRLMNRVLRARGGDIEIEWQPQGLRAVLSLKARSGEQILSK